MSVACQNPSREPHQIGDGDRKLTLSALIVWGEHDLRDDWTGDYVFCSFGCLSEWAAARAGDHDGVVLRDGVVEQLAPAAEVALEATSAEIAAAVDAAVQVDTPVDPVQVPAA